MSLRLQRALRVVMEPIERRVLLTSLDPTWNGTGFQNQPFADNTGEGNRVSVISLGQFSDGKVAELVEEFHDFDPTTYALVRHNADGTLDTTFGTNGILALSKTPSKMVV